MRLVDADKIDFGKVFIGASDFAKDTREAAQNLIDEQPTAYDVDKVVEQLDKFKTSTWSEILEENIEVVNLERAIKIVKSGGIR